MKTRIIDLFQQNSIGIYLFEHLGEASFDNARIAVVESDGTLSFVPAEEKVKLPFSSPVQLSPTVELPVPVVEEIVKWYRQTYPTRHADDAIKDARATRDRLLSLVEISTMDKIESPVAAIAAVKELRR